MNRRAFLAGSAAAVVVPWGPGTDMVKTFIQPYGSSDLIAEWVSGPALNNSIRLPAEAFQRFERLRESAQTVSIFGRDLHVISETNYKGPTFPSAPDHGKDGA